MKIMNKIFGFYNKMLGKDKGISLDVALEKNVSKRLLDKRITEGFVEVENVKTDL